MRKVIPAYERRMTASIITNRNAYVSKLLKSIKGKSITEAKKIINNAAKEDYFNKIYVNLYASLGLNIARSQYKISNTQKADADVLEAAWLLTLDKFIKKNIGAKVVTLTGTLKERLIMNLEKLVNEAIVEGIGIEKLTNDIVKEMGKTYSAQTKWMARRIAHTETMACASVAQTTAVDSLGIRYWKIWQATLINTRKQHVAMIGVRVKDDKPFVLPNGDKMMYPQDGRLGAQAGNVINCSCFLVFEPVR